MGKKILIIEDEPDICEELKRWLERENGYEVDVAAHEQEAMALLAKSRYDLLLVDILLQGFYGGADVIAHFKNRPDRPKIFIITAVISYELERLLREKGITHVVDKILKKPDDAMPDKVIPAVKEAIG